MPVLLLAFAVADVQAQDLKPRLDPPAEPAIFLPGIVSTDLGERDASFHPNGLEFYFTVWTGRFGVIAVSQFEDGEWLEPETASFSGRYNDLEPFVAPDGRQLYFASSRPLEGEEEPGDFNLWVADRTGSGWGEPRPLSLNTEVNEFYPSLDRNGTIYWTASYEGSAGGEDIYYATPSDTGHSAPMNLGPGVNTEHDEFNALIAPDGSWLAFGSFGRDDGNGGGDLYLSFKKEDGTFDTAIHLDLDINGSALDFCPALTPDGRGFLFSSRRSSLDDTSDEPRGYRALADALRSTMNGQSDVYWVDAGFIEHLRPDTQ